MAPTRRAVLLCNLGSPAAPTPEAVEAFLDEFLSDRRVVDLNPWVWRLLRRRLVLPRRRARVAEAYRSIWTERGSPLLVHGIELRDALAARLGEGARVELAMRYGEPSIARALERLSGEGFDSVRAIPLFAQFSETTTGSVEAELERAARDLARPIAVDVLRSHHADPGYVAALAARVREALAAGPVDHFVWSFHGLPVRYVERGDPYADEARTTARLLARELGLEDAQWSLAWQSRFGRERWLEPTVETVVPELARKHRRVLVACPGFAADCLETLEELGVRLRRAFLDAGGEELRLVPCLNAHPAWVEALAKLC